MKNIYTIATTIIIFSLFIGFMIYVKDVSKISDAHDYIQHELGIEGKVTSIIYMSKNAVDLAHPKRGYYVNYIDENGKERIQLVEGTDSIRRQWKIIRNSMTEEKFDNFTIFWIMVISLWAIILSIRIETINYPDLKQ